MHRIYFENRCIIICGPDEQALSDPNSVEFHFGGTISIHSLVAMFEASESLSRIYIPTDNTGWMYRKVCAEFREVDAAGGLVSNRRGDYLLIRRYGLWDLPKGHRELELRDPICVTDHCYLRGGIWHLKHTWWYNMLYTDPVDLTPQREEDITKAAWVARSSLPSFLKNTYPSIVEVFREAK